jgi:hypothetical protein
VADAEQHGEGEVGGEEGECVEEVEEVVAVVAEEEEEEIAAREAEDDASAVVCSSVGTMSTTRRELFVGVRLRVVVFCAPTVVGAFLGAFSLSCVDDVGDADGRVRGREREAADSTPSHSSEMEWRHAKGGTSSRQ